MWLWPKSMLCQALLSTSLSAPDRSGGDKTKPLEQDPDHLLGDCTAKKLHFWPQKSSLGCLQSGLSGRCAFLLAGHWGRVAQDGSHRVPAPGEDWGLLGKC